jgi:PadR family transcriptional regulator, regulatory protein AphA
MSLKHVILVALASGPFSGYEIVKEFDLVLGNFWQATHQQVYRELGKLADEGLVEFEIKPQTGKPDRKVYRTTPSGRAALEAWLAEPLPPVSVKNLLLVKLYASDDAETVRRHITRFRDECRRTLEIYRHIAERHYPEPVDEMEGWKKRAWLTLRHGIVQREAQLSWADEAMNCLFEAPMTRPEG